VVIPTLRDALVVALALGIEQRSRLVLVLLETLSADEVSGARSVEWWQREVERRLQDDTGQWEAVDETVANVRAIDRGWS
jgi:hypothetical protein